MSEHLLIDPNKLYKLYSSQDVKDYYPFLFLPEFNSIEIDIFYDILNSLSLKRLSNMTTYIFKQWSLTKKMLELGDIGPIKRKKDILNMTYVNETILSKEQLNDNLCQFIQRDRVMALYTMNQMLKFLYPCKV